MKQQAIKITAYQATAHYRKPMTFQYMESYPLPPYSTVIGMVHALCGFSSYQPMQVSVQGNIENREFAIEARKSFRSGRLELAPDGSVDERYSDVVRTSTGEETGIVTGYGYVELLSHVHLTLHILPEDPELLDTIHESLLFPRVYPSLGRKEDMIQIQKVEKVDVEEVLVSDMLVLEQGAYVPQDQLTSHIHTEATVYPLNKTYRLEKGRRVWEQVEAAHLSSHSDIITAGTVFNASYVKKDKDGRAVFFA